MGCGTLAAAMLQTGKVSPRGMALAYKGFPVVSTHQCLKYNRRNVGTL